MTEHADVIENTLVIPIPSSDQLVLDDYRRLTGPGLLWEEAGAVIDVLTGDFRATDVINQWNAEIHRILTAVGWEEQKSIHRTYDGGISLAISAPMDQLYSAMFAVQTAWHFCAGTLLGERVGNFSAMAQDLQNVMAREANPSLLALIKAASEHDVDILCDDDDLSLGHGIGSRTWSVMDLPAPEDVDWSSLYDVPVALITGTNGKTTTTRLSAAIGKAAGKVSGLTSTEFVRVGEDILDHGDYSGPGGGRMVLRDQRLEIAYLEVARGGILRRGLPLRRARVAVITNVAADHLGQYGVNTVEELAVAKFAVHRALTEDGVLVLNADDPYVLAEAANTQATIWWFSLDRDNSKIEEFRNNGMPCSWLDGDSVVFFDGTAKTPIINVQDIPLALGGAARYNIGNAMAAVCVSRAMGIDDMAIRKGLSEFQSDPRDNPGRCNEFTVRGARVFVDFAHNPHSISAITQAMGAIPANRRFIMLSHAGDRSDQDIRDVTNSAFALNPDFVMAVELPDYLRGRELGEITTLITEECRSQGLADSHILTGNTPTEGAAHILELLQSGDLALLLVLSERDAIFDLLENANE